MFLPERLYNGDLAVRRELAASLRHVTAAGSSVFSCSPATIEDVCGEIERHRVEPTLFARYYELVLGLKAARNDDAVALWIEIAEQARRLPPFRTVPFGHPSIAAESSRYLRWLSPGNGSALIETPDLQHWADFETSVTAAFDLIERADPVLGAELRSLVAEVVGASPHRDVEGSFGGASTFMLWGSVFLNVDLHLTRVDAVAGLVHEGAHQLLFGLSCREPLLNNALSERYSSPLRRDLRPAIGIYHAAFVCARMCHAFRAMLRPGLDITDGERRSLEDRLAQSRAHFAEGFDTLRREADLTSLGRRLLDEAATALEPA